MSAEVVIVVITPNILNSTTNVEKFAINVSGEEETTFQTNVSKILIYNYNLGRRNSDGNQTHIW